MKSRGVVGSGNYLSVWWTTRVIQISDRPSELLFICSSSCVNTVYICCRYINRTVTTHSFWTVRKPFRYRPTTPDGTGPWEIIGPKVSTGGETISAVALNRYDQVHILCSRHDRNAQIHIAFVVQNDANESKRSLYIPGVGCRRRV